VGASLEVADIVRRYGDRYRLEHPVSLAQRRVMRAIEECRTAALGGHVEQCDRCQHVRVWYNSCLMESPCFWGASWKTGVHDKASRPFDSPLPGCLEPGEQRVRRSKRPLP